MLHTGWRPQLVAFMAFAVVAAGGVAAQDANWLPNPPPAAAPKDDGQWAMPSKNYASTRYSELSEVNAGNVDRLKVAFTFSTGVNRGHEAPPLIVGATMYVLTPYPNILYALDLSQSGAPIKWRYDPKPEAAAQ